MARVQTGCQCDGPWVDSVLRTTAPDARQLIGGTKGSHIIVSPFDGAPKETFYIEAAADGRPFFVIPWNGLYLIGTTDIRYDGSLDECRASRAEIDYLLAETNRAFPSASLTVGDIHYTYSGVRPLPARKKGPESAITRKHIILVNQDIAANLVSIIGGKLTTYRHLAEQAVDKVGKLLKRRLPACRTHDTLLPGGGDLDETRHRLSKSALSSRGQQRLLDLYGNRTIGILDLAENEPALASVVADRHDLLAAEIAFVARREFPRTLADIVFRRTMIGLDADQSRSSWAAVADVAAAELDWAEDRVRDELQALTDYGDSLLPAGE